MKKIITGILAFCIGSVGTISAHIITVSNNAVNAGQYTNLQTAVTAAHAGDTIYVMGSPTDYGAVTITTPRITLIGAGYAVTGLQYNYSTTVDYVYLNGAVNGVKIQGFYINGNMQQSGTAMAVDSVDVERCYVTGYIYVYGSFWKIRNNNIDNLNVQDNANVYIQNNFIEDVGSMNSATDTIDHNDFTTYGGNVTSYSGATSNAVFTNNVFYYCNPENTTSCTFKNNLTVHNPAMDLNVYAGNTGIGNLNTATNPGWTDATIPASTVSQNVVWKYNWTFTGASFAHNAATDGSDIGVYGGKYPMPNLVGFPHIPQMVSMTVTGEIPQGANSNLNFKAQGIMANGVASGEYFFDADPGVGNGTPISFASFDSVNISQAITTSSLTPTIHVIGVRVKDSSGHWSLYQASSFYVQPVITIPAPPMIVAAEYFFDKDPGQGLGTAIPTGAAADSVNINTTVSVSSLTAGFHSLFIRTENASGQWSLYEGRRFYIQPTVVIPPAPMIVAAEYFFDKDPGQGYGTSIATGAPADSVNINGTYSIGSLTVGFHRMFTRTENANGQWSLYEGRGFYVSPSPKAIPPASPIVAAEYFFDKDPGQGYGTSVAVTKGDSVNVSITPTISLSAGFHKMFIRTQDSAGMWSLYEGRNLYVQPSVPAYVAPKIVAAEFFYDKDPGVGMGSAISGITAGDSINITQHLNAAALAVGPHVACIRVEDSTGHWSLYEARSFTVKVCSVATSASVLNNVSCFGGNNGSAVALPSKGTLPYSYSWSTSPLQNKDTANNLTAGTYTITVTDSTGCFALDSVKIIQPSKINVKSVKVVNTICDSANGQALVSATGGTGTITFAWNTSPVTTGPIVTKLAAGSYVVTATDGNSCNVTDTIKIAPSTLPAINVTVAGNACGDSIGKAVASVTVGTGTPPYGYRWTNGDSINIASDLKAGLYIVTVTDKNNCLNTAPAIITDTNGPAISPVIKNVSCYQGSDGAISVTVIGGTGPYKYLWSNGATTQNIAALSAAPYQVTVTDKTGCQGVATFNVTQPFPLVINSTSVSSACATSTGSATANVTGGTSPYTYDWTSTGATTATATGLSAGAYTVIVQDADGCADTGYAAVNNTSGPVVSVKNISDANCSTGIAGIVNLTVTGGTGSLNYVWSNTTTADSLVAPSGNYNVTVTDALGCTGTAIMTIPDSPPAAPQICLVTVDTNEKNQVIWNKATTSHIKSFNIYRETTSAGVYTVAASVPYNSLSVWEDPVANPDVRSYTYKLSQVDSCGEESPLSAEAKTMHMTANVGVGKTVNLIWDNYIGLASIPYYVVYRDTIHNNYTAIDTVPNDGIYSFTDVNPLITSATVYYRMGIYDPAGCSPHTHGVESINYNASKSNTGNLVISGVDVLNAELSSMMVYPNPSTGVVNFTLDLTSKQNVTLKIYNTLGQVMSVTNYGKLTGHVSKRLDLSGLSKGVYIFQVIGDDGNMYKKVILQ